MEGDPMVVFELLETTCCTRGRAGTPGGYRLQRPASATGIEQRGEERRGTRGIRT